jgi:uncharacterized membrane protein
MGLLPLSLLRKNFVDSSFGINLLRHKTLICVFWALLLVFSAASAENLSSDTPCIHSDTLELSEMAATSNIVAAFVSKAATRSVKSVRNAQKNRQWGGYIKVVDPGSFL